MSKLIALKDKVVNAIADAFDAEPAVIGGAVASAISGTFALVSGPGLDNGLQVDEVLAIVGPFLAALGIRLKAVSPKTDKRRTREGYNRGRRAERKADR